MHGDNSWCMCTLKSYSVLALKHAVYGECWSQLMVAPVRFVIDFQFTGGLIFWARWWAPVYNIRWTVYAYFLLSLTGSLFRMKTSYGQELEDKKAAGRKAKINPSKALRKLLCTVSWTKILVLRIYILQRKKYTWSLRNDPKDYQVQLWYAKFNIILLQVSIYLVDQMLNKWFKKLMPPSSPCNANIWL